MHVGLETSVLRMYMCIRVCIHVHSVLVILCTCILLHAYTHMYNVMCLYMYIVYELWDYYTYSIYSKNISFMASCVYIITASDEKLIYTIAVL